MLPDFPSIKRECRKIIERIIQNYNNKDSILSQIKVYRDFEGNKMSTSDIDGNIELLPYRKFLSEKSIKDEDIINKGLEIYYENGIKMANELKSKIEAHMFQEIEDNTKKGGTWINAMGRPFSTDLLLEALERIQLNFDDDGNPKFPTMVVSPEMFEKIKDKLPAVGEDQNFDKRLEELILMKKQEWHDRESNRKLVD